MFPSVAANPDYTTIISDAHFQRLQSLLADAAEQGATLRMAHEPERAQAEAARKCLPTLVLGATPGMRVLREEIFGPILPVLPYDDIDAVLANVNAADRPLALYWFGADRERGEHVLANTLSGTVGMNDTLMQIAHKNLPFGGVGASGMGAYHGETGFRTFSKLRPVLDQSRFSVGGMLYPPYGRAFEQTLGMVKKLS
jgi:coniferyl-aldehyde dehydrogenase